MNNILKKYNINKEEPIIVGVSSGPDSMCLIEILKKETNNIICCHINHNVRDESKKEEEYLKNYCKENNIIFECYKIESYHENNFENEARKKRYSFYKKTLAKYNSKYLFLAHHGDDLIETVLMKIVRGSNIEGYAGIKEVSNLGDFSIIRPLLNYTKDDILEYNKNNNIKYFIDKSNLDNTYTRNRYRNNLLPFLKKEDAIVHKKFLKYSKTLLEYDTYIKKEINIALNNIYNNGYIDINKFNQYDLFIKKNILFTILNQEYGNNPNIIKEKNIEDIIKMTDNQKPNLQVNLPKNKIALKEYNKLIITNKVIIDDNYKIEFKKDIIIDNFIIKKIDNTNKDGNDICRLNSKNITLPLYLRNKKNSDFMYIKGTDGKKKIKDIFIDAKIPLSKRKRYPLLVDANDNILWIPNIKKSQFNVKKDEKCDIILNVITKEEDNE